MKPLLRYLLTLAAAITVSGAIIAVNRPSHVTTEESAVLELAREVFPRARETMRPSEAETDFTWVFDEDGEHLGSILVSSPHSDHVIGYAGPTPLLIAVDPGGEIVRVVLLDNVETPSYVRLLLDSEFVERWRGMSWRQAAEETGEVDAVSGVTITADAIARTLRHRLALVDPDALVAPPPRPSIELGLTDVVVILVALAGIIMGLLPGRLPRWTRLAQLGVAFLVLGVATAAMLSMALFAAWLRSGRIAGPLGLILLAAMAVVVPIVFRKNLYCHFVCPFGAVQEVLFRIVPFRLKVPFNIHRRLRYVRYGILVLVAVSLLAGLALDPSDLEPFPAFRPGAAGLAAILIAVFAILLAPVTSRPWCTYACGTGALLDLLRRPRTKKVPAPPEAFAARLPSGPE